MLGEYNSNVSLEIMENPIGCSVIKFSWPTVVYYIKKESVIGFTDFDLIDISSIYSFQNILSVILKSE